MKRGKGLSKNCSRMDRVHYSIEDKQDTPFVLETLNQLPSLLGSILYSDQGSVYTSQTYQEAVKEKSIIMSMSRKGTPADNALIESFHLTLKSESFYLEGLLVHRWSSSYRSFETKLLTITQLAFKQN